MPYYCSAALQTRIALLRQHHIRNLSETRLPVRTQLLRTLEAFRRYFTKRRNEGGSGATPSIFKRQQSVHSFALGCLTRAEQLQGAAVRRIAPAVFCTIRQTPPHLHSTPLRNGAHTEKNPGRSLD